MEVVNELLKQMATYTPIYTLSSLELVLGGRAGIFNVSGEGTMLAAASAGYIVALQTGNRLLGILAAAAMGAALDSLWWPSTRPPRTVSSSSGSRW